jgi:two-component system response regulator AtoC
VLTAAEVRLAFQKDMQLLPPVTVTHKAASLSDTLREVEKSLITGALQRAGGKQTEAAKLLGISAKNLWNKLQKHAIDPSDYA